MDGLEPTHENPQDAQNGLLVSPALPRRVKTRLSANKAAELK